MVIDKLKHYQDEIEFDGDPIVSDTGKIACIKSPEGLMIGIFESNDSNLDEDNFNVDYNADAKLDPVSKEIKGFLEKFKL
jgi:hypothetical protein